MISIVDVAKAAGVSNKTVSRVVNGEPNVKPATKERVEKAIAELGYVPNMAARSVRSNRSNTLGIITDCISTTPYSGDIVRGIQDWAEEHGRTVLLANTNGDVEKERQIWRTFQAHRIDGVLYASMYHREISPTAGDVVIPTVLLNCHPVSSSGYASIEPDDYQGSRDLTKYVLSRGHRRIGYVRLNPSLLGAELRLAAFQEAIAEAGLGAADVDVRLGMEGEIGQEVNHVFEIVKAMLSKPERPTAILCGNDEMALQAYLAALGLGLRIPQDVSIVGFDDFKTVSTALKPALTTVALPYYDLGYQGADRLNQLIAGESLDNDALVLACRIVERGSCR
ncbi:LacI family DNA-binding transcriptional regulator [Limimaricola sp. AA108-03]|uniref:LacI family DNA-binding transcriptional regulator n=1 Tax=Limimaricola sp. AA108-03 TaxID=3425945 RepID=UPI003D780E38